MAAILQMSFSDAFFSHEELCFLSITSLKFACPILIEIKSGLVWVMTETIVDISPMWSRMSFVSSKALLFPAFFIVQVYQELCKFNLNLNI